MSPKIFRAFLLVALLTFVVPVFAQKDSTTIDGVGLVASDRATTKDLGLPVYPGARLSKDHEDDSPAANLGMWGPSHGFRLLLMKFESGDSPDKVAAFYRKQLNRYGKVLDCTDPSALPKGNASELACDKDDKSAKNEITLKAGTRQDQHVVGIHQENGLTKFQLVRVLTKGDD